MNIKFKKTLLLSSIALINTGCASYQQTVTDSSNERDQIKNETREQYEKLQREEVTNFNVIDGFFLTDKNQSVDYKEKYQK